MTTPFSENDIESPRWFQRHYVSLLPKEMVVSWSWQTAGLLSLGIGGFLALSQLQKGKKSKVVKGTQGAAKVLGCKELVVMILDLVPCEDLMACERVNVLWYRHAVFAKGWRIRARELVDCKRGSENWDTIIATVLLEPSPAHSWSMRPSLERVQFLNKRAESSFRLSSQGPAAKDWWCSCTHEVWCGCRGGTTTRAVAVEPRAAVGPRMDTIKTLVQLYQLNDQRVQFEWKIQEPRNPVEWHMQRAVFDQKLSTAFHCKETVREDTASFLLSRPAGQVPKYLLYWIRHAKRRPLTVDEARKMARPWSEW